MNITQVRNATQLITYAGKRFLIDPMLAPKDAYPGFSGTARADIRNPMVELPVDIATLLDVDAVIVTHTHDDHWDRAAVEQIPRDKPIYLQNDSDAALLPQAKIVATHMEAINHCLLTRRALRQYAEDNQISDVLSIPEDGESVQF